MEIYENAAPASTSSNASLPTATCLTSYTSKDDGMASIAPADMLNVWNAQKMSSKGSGTVNTADGMFNYTRKLTTLSTTMHFY